MIYGKGISILYKKYDPYIGIRYVYIYRNQEILFGKHFSCCLNKILWYLDPMTFYDHISLKVSKWVKVYSITKDKVILITNNQNYL